MTDNIKLFLSSLRFDNLLIGFWLRQVYRIFILPPPPPRCRPVSAQNNLYFRQVSKKAFRFKESLFYFKWF